MTTDAAPSTAPRPAVAAYHDGMVWCPECMGDSEWQTPDGRIAHPLSASALSADSWCLGCFRDYDPATGTWKDHSPYSD